MLELGPVEDPVASADEFLLKAIVVVVARREAAKPGVDSLSCFGLAALARTPETGAAILPDLSLSIRSRIRRISPRHA
jgi:hypothetical protein